MANKLFEVDFESLAVYVKQLSDSEKGKLLNILLESKTPIVNEQASVYSKVSKNKSEFENKWKEVLTTEEFKSKIVQHIDNLPWR